MRRSFYYIKRYEEKIETKHKKKSAMHTLKKLALFLGCNIVGFFLPALLYLFSLITRIIDLSAKDFDVSSFFLGTTETAGSELLPIPLMLFFPTLTWIICAIFSFSYFFVSRKWKRFFLLMPLLLPFLHAFVLMLKFV